MRAEAVANAYITLPAARLSAEDCQPMTSLGWCSPTEFSEQEKTSERHDDGSPDFFMDLAHPVDFKQLEESAVSAMRSIYGIKHLWMPEYKSFAVSGAEIRFPTLRLKREGKQSGRPESSPK